MKATKITYWTTTGLFSLAMTYIGYLDVIHAPDLAAGMTHLGYPAYALDILGVAKLLGVIALLYPKKLVLKEWAYAGFTFNLIGAFWSHTAVDGIATAGTSFILLVIMAVSYYCYHKVFDQVSASDLYRSKSIIPVVS